jgi:hypothetical protein
MVAHIFSESLKLMTETEGEGGVVDPEDGNSPKAPSFFYRFELSQNYSVIFGEIKPLVVEKDEDQPNGDQLFVVARAREVEEELKCGSVMKGKSKS